jgi:hypothetical protein
LIVVARRRNIGKVKPSNGRQSPILTKLPQDRRASSRFPLPEEAQYRMLDGRTELSGSGKVLDISSNGVRFTTQAAIPAGARLQVSVAWPVQLDGGCPLKLVALGRVVRSEPNEAAIAIEKYEFRTKARAARA